MGHRVRRTPKPTNIDYTEYFIPSIRIEREEREEREKYQAERQRIFKKRRKTMMVMFAVAVGIVCAFLLWIGVLNPG